MPQLELAIRRQEALGGIADRVAAQALRAWNRGIGTDLTSGWARVAPAVTGAVTAGQMLAAAGASPYLARVAVADDNTDPSAGGVQAGAFAGVDGSGRTIDGLMYGSVTTAYEMLGAGQGIQAALNAGATYLVTMAHTAILDTGRSADLTAMTTRHYTHYVRVISPGACSRCAILAGISSAKTAFQRHPRCRCTAAPITDDETVKGRFRNPSDYFDAMSKQEQDRIFTTAGADAIRAGADPIKVVTARRGAPGIDYSRAVITPDTVKGRTMVRTVIGTDREGRPILGYTTAESTTRRGAYGTQNRVATGNIRPPQRVRLMPETIVGLTDDVTLRQILLRDAGYVSYPLTGEEMRSPLGGTYHARRAELIRQDRIVADDFYRQHGIII